MVINDRTSTAHNVAVQDEHGGLFATEESLLLMEELSGERGLQSQEHQGTQRSPGNS